MLPSGRRFIPAPAGNSAFIRRAAGGSTVHPRACGEQVPTGVKRALDDGSSPRLRGTVKRRRKLNPALRFIPAPAGNSAYPTSNHSKRAVHPRACGEQHVHPDHLSPPYGSSPRLRGTVFRGIANQEQVRFIPAPAGNRHVTSPLTRIDAVHPRACGEQGSEDSVCSSAGGSSPRLRGTVRSMRWSD